MLYYKACPARDTRFRFVVPSTRGRKRRRDHEHRFPEQLILVMSDDGGFGGKKAGLLNAIWECAFGSTVAQFGNDDDIYVFR